MIRIEDYTVPKPLGPFTVHNVTPAMGGESFLFVAEDVSFVYETGFGFEGATLCEKVRAVLQGRPLDYILLTHAHYDHAMGSGILKAAYPAAKVIIHSYGAYVFTREGARRTMERLDEEAAKSLGAAPRPGAAALLQADIPVEEGELLQLGFHPVRVLHLPGHTKDCIAFWFEEDGFMLGCESMGIPEDNDRFICAPLVSFRQCLQAYDRVSALPLDAYFIPHRGTVTGEDLRFYFEQGQKDFLFARDLILSLHRQGRSEEEIILTFEETFRGPECSRLYPRAAFLENMHAMIPMILKEYGTET